MSKRKATLAETLDGRQAFVKFFRQASNRAARNRPVPDNVRASGSHRICTYPQGRRPRAVRDNASPEDVERRPWLSRWSHFIRVRDVEFVDGVLGDGVPLSELMDELGPAFGPTAENADRGVGNVDPRKSIRQAAAIRLSEAGASWLGEELEARFREFGKLPGHELDID